MNRPPATPKPPAPPSRETLHEAALAYLARFAAGEAALLRVLERRILRWARTTDAEPAEQAAARALAREEVARLAAAGLVDDAAFAAMRARRLRRAGRSRLAVAAHLAARGIAAEPTRAALPEDAEAELLAAVALARRRRLGPFRPAVEEVPDVRVRALGVFARAGFAQPVAEQVLGLDSAEANTLLQRLRRG
jgi:regulatory protein